MTNQDIEVINIKLKEGDLLSRASFSCLTSSPFQSGKQKTLDINGWFLVYTREYNYGPVMEIPINKEVFLTVAAAEIDIAVRHFGYKHYFPNIIDFRGVKLCQYLQSTGGDMNPYSVHSDIVPEKKFENGMFIRNCHEKLFEFADNLIANPQYVFKDNKLIKL